MNEDLLVLAYFIILFGTIMLWLVLAKLLFNQLVRVHPEKYESMGKPTLQDGGTDVQQTFSLIKYLANREYLSLNDPYLSRISNIMRALLIGLPIYFICSTALIIVNLQGVAWVTNPPQPKAGDSYGAHQAGSCYLGHSRSAHFTG